MPENDELRAAARRLADRDLADYQGPTGDDTDMRAGIMLAHAYLAHPPLTGERVAAAVGELVGPYKSGLFDPEELAHHLCRLLGVEEK